MLYAYISEWCDHFEKKFLTKMDVFKVLLYCTNVIYKALKKSGKFILKEALIVYIFD